MSGNMSKRLNGRRVPSRSSLARFQEVCQRLGAMLLLAVSLCAQAEAELFDLVRLSSLANANYTPGEVALMDPLMALDEQPHERRRQFGASNDLAASSAKQPPVYLSAPKQISSAKEIHKHHQQHQPELHHQRQAIEHVKAKEVDLNVAADHYTKESSRRKHKKPRKQAKKVKKTKTTKKKKNKKKKKVVVRKNYKKVKVVLMPYKHEKPSYRSHHQPQVAGAKFYEYREVPKKGAWRFGYKRGNAKHLIERKEDGHKSRFKSVVKWMADKGKGHHLFDYNHHGHQHGDKGKQHYHAAAAKVRPAVAAPQHLHQEPARNKLLSVV